MTRQVQSNQVKSAVLSNQLMTVAKTVTASQLILSGSKQVLTPIMGKSTISNFMEADCDQSFFSIIFHTLMIFMYKFCTYICSRDETCAYGVTDDAFFPSSTC